MGWLHFLDCMKKQYIARTHGLTVEHCLSSIASFYCWLKPQQIKYIGWTHNNAVKLVKFNQSLSWFCWILFSVPITAVLFSSSLWTVIIFRKSSWGGSFRMPSVLYPSVVSVCNGTVSHFSLVTSKSVSSCKSVLWTSFMFNDENDEEHMQGALSCPTGEQTK